MKSPSCLLFEKLHTRFSEDHLRPWEKAFCDRHAKKCKSCRELGDTLDLALNLLKDHTYEFEGSEEFEENVIRKWRVEKDKPTAWAYWSPSLIGAAVAAIALLAILQVLAATPQSPSYNTKGQEARLGTSRLPEFPGFETDAHSR
jgi:hypothetical protein